ncbi:MAG: TonB-dependent receptor plug domain-containing protein, partial [Pseudomonadota bacterium]
MSELLADKSIHVARSLLTVVLATLAHCFSAVAQVDGELLQPRVYVPADFARFAPRTALDMARQVPGFPIDEGGQGRGFGQANTNILINGRRVSGKSNGPINTLRRIPVDGVSRLEVVDGASLDIGGLSGQVLNVITVADRGISGRFSYSMQSRTDHVPTRWRDGALSFAGGNRASEWTLNLRNEQSKSGDAGPEFVTDGPSTVVETRDERRVESFDIPGVAGSYTYLGQGGQVLNASGEVNAFILEFQERSERNPIDGDSGIRRLRETEDEFNFEVGFDYEQDALSGRLKLIGIHRYEDSPTVADVRLDVVSDGSIAGSRFERRAEEAETLLRSEFTHRAFDGDWQWALEGAFNFLDIEAALEVRDNDGQLRTVPAPGASSRVEEDRFELTVSYGRAL